MKTWFTSDTHFNQERTLQLSKRPFNDVGDMNHNLISNWNNVVGKNDTVFHLGDFGDISYSRYLNGSINLLAGNYELENYTMKQLRECFNLVVNIKRVPMGIIDSKTFETTDVLCVHEPSNSDFSKFTLFGHIHKLQMVKRNGLNVGTDCHNFTPIDEDTILFYKNAIENFYDNDVFMTGKDF